MDARLDVGPKIALEHNLRMLYWNANGLGDDWDGQSSRKFDLLRANGRYDLIGIAETHLGATSDSLPGDEWIFSEPVGKIATQAQRFGSDRVSAPQLER